MRVAEGEGRGESPMRRSQRGIVLHMPTHCVIDAAAVFEKLPAPGVALWGRVGSGGEGGGWVATKPGTRRRGNRYSIIVTTASLAVERHRIVSAVAGTAVKRVRFSTTGDIRQGHSEENLRGEGQAETRRREGRGGRKILRFEPCSRHNGGARVSVRP